MSEENIHQLETVINSVIVYQTGVQISQLGEIDLAVGEQAVVIPELPESLDKESIRVKGIGNGKVLNINVDFTSKREYKTEEQESLQEERERLEKEIERKRQQVNRINEQISKYKNTEDSFYGDWAKAFAFGEVNFEKFQDFNDAISKKLEEKSKQVEELEEDLEELNKQLQVINNKISNLGIVEEVQNYYEIWLAIDVKKEGTFKIEIKYSMKGAWWVPFYDVTLKESDAQLTMMANVYNRTGMDWNNVELEISTASLKPIKLEKPNPMILQEYSPGYYDMPTTSSSPGGLRGGSFGRREDKAKDIVDGLIADIDYDYEEDKPAIEQAQADVSENLGIQSFKIPNRIEISCDENPHPVNLSFQDLETKKKYYWTVMSPSQVVIQDTLINGDLLLLPGNVKIYYMEEFIGETQIPLVAPKEKFKLGTRASYDLKINKKLIDRSKSKKAIKGKLKNSYEHEILIKNLNDVSEPLIMFDRIPHSSSEKIEVEILEISPEPDKRQLGILKWKITNLEGKEEMRLHYKYEIEYKKDVVITPPLP